MSEHKTAEELAAEITIAALSAASERQLPDGQTVCDFFRAIYKEICHCKQAPSSKKLEL